MRQLLRQVVRQAIHCTVLGSDVRGNPGTLERADQEAVRRHPDRVRGPGAGAALAAVALTGCGSGDERPVELAANQPAVDSTRAVLGPFGFRHVRLGMPVQAAVATGELVRHAPADLADCRSFDLRGYPATELGAVDTENDHGVLGITAAGAMKTPEGIGIGSAEAAVRKAYRHLATGEGDAYTTAVPGNPKAYYLIQLAGGRVTELSLRLDAGSYDCD